MMVVTPAVTVVTTGVEELVDLYGPAVSAADVGVTDSAADVGFADSLSVLVQPQSSIVIVVASVTVYVDEP